MFFFYSDLSLCCQLNSGLPHPGKVLDFFAVLESPWIVFISPECPGKCMESFPVIYQTRM